MAQKAFDLLPTCDRLVEFRLDLAQEFQLRGDKLYFWHNSNTLAGWRPFDLGHEYERKGWIAGMTSLKQLRGLLNGSIRISAEGSGDDEEPRMVEVPTTKTCHLFDKIKLRWKRPPLWAHEERGEAEKRTQRWRQGIDQMCDEDSVWREPGVPAWQSYELTMEKVEEDLGRDSEPDEWV